MKRLLLAFLLIASAAKADPDNYVQIEAGRGLATAGDCVACHTAPGGTRFAGGRGISTPFGVINSANLTPDLETGLAGWSEAEFHRAMTQGIRRDGVHLYPAFPYPFYTKISRDDSDAIFAFLRTLPATSNRVNRSSLPFPFSIRAAMIGWNAINFTPGAFKPEPSRSPEFNRGAYLVEGLGHCGACHTPMNVIGGSKSGQAFQGNAIQDWWAPSLTNDQRTGLGAWSVDEIVEYLQTGRNTRTAASGPMAEVVQYSTALMPTDDLKAIATYLKERERPNPNLSPPTPPAPLPASDAAVQAGAAIYTDTCSACHSRAGEGIPRLFPRLAGNAMVQQSDTAGLTRIVLGGGRAAATTVAPTSPAMPALGWRLDDAQAAAVLTYIRNSWGNSAAAVTPGEVAKMRTVLARP